MLTVGAVLSPCVFACNDRNGKKVHVSSTSKRNWSNRDLTPDVNVWYYPDEDQLELTCYEPRETSVYILSSTGEEISCDGFNSDMTPSYTVEAPDTPGTYWIVIDSPVIYAEGSFVVK